MLYIPCRVKPMWISTCMVSKSGMSVSLNNLCFVCNLVQHSLRAPLGMMSDSAIKPSLTGVNLALNYLNIRGIPFIFLVVFNSDPPFYKTTTEIIKIHSNISDI